MWPLKLGFVNMAVTWTTLLALLAGVVALVHVLVKRSKIARLVNLIPGPPCLPLLGNVWDLVVPQKEIFETFLGLFDKFPKEPVVRLWLGTGPYVVVKEAQALETILTSNLHISKSDDYGFMHQWLGFGLLTSEGKKWFSRRKMLTPTFHFRILEDFIPVFNDQSTILVNILNEKVGTGKFNVYPYITLCALDIISETAMGKSIGAQENSETDYIKAIHEMGKILLLRVTRPWLQPPWLFNLTPTRQREKKALAVIHSFARQVIKERRQSRAKENVKVELVDELGRKKRLAFLDMLLEMSENGQDLSDEDIRSEVDTFMFEGHDTTTAGINWTIHLLAKHQDVQRKVQEELDDVLGAVDNPITSADLTKLKYLEAVVKESLRLYPSVPIFGRKLKEQFKIGGFDIPADTTVFICPLLAHQDEKVFPEPEKFDPTRFLGDNVVGRHPYAYIPFAAGPRNCIGQRFAVMEEKTVLAYIFRNFNVTSHDGPENLKRVAEPILRPADGVTISIERRNV